MSDGDLYVRRAELRLARGAERALQEIGLDPDPLAAFAAVAASLRDETEDDYLVAIDMMPASPMRRRRLRKRLERRSNRQQPGKAGALDSALMFVGDVFDEAAGAKGSSNGSGSLAGLTGRMQPVDVVHRRRDMQSVGAKLLEPDAMMELQVLLRARSLDRRRASEILAQLVAAFGVFDGDNELRVASVGKLRRLGADAPGRRGWFDYRMDTGYFCPRGESVVNAREIMGLLKPPTLRCRPRNFAGAGPYLAPPPRDLPIYDQLPGVLPLGRVRRGDREVDVGMLASEFFFGFYGGRARSGKTETALNMLVHVATIEEHGALFFDPHEDAIVRVRPYLTGRDVRERVVEMNLAKHGLDQRHVAWNLLSMQGLAEDRISGRANAIADSMAVATGYTASTARRTTAIMQNAVTALLHLAVQLPADLQPTIFTIPKLLLDEEWREAAVARLPERYRSYWSSTFASYPVDATSPLCGAISRLQTNPVVHATFGTPESTYDPRAAMDDGSIVLAAPPLNDQMVSSLVVQVHIDAARSRTDIPAADRQVFYVFLDETQTYDQATGARGSAVAELLEQTGKYGVRALVLAQSPTRLSEATLDALTTNASFLGTHATSADGASFFAKQWADFDVKKAVSRQRRFHSIAQPTWRGQRIDPFRVAGVPLEEQWAEIRDEGALDDLDAAIDERCRPRTVRETLEMIEGHDERMLHALRNGRRHALSSVVEHEENPFVLTDGLSVVPANPRRD